MLWRAQLHSAPFDIASLPACWLLAAAHPAGLLGLMRLNHKDQYSSITPPTFLHLSQGCLFTICHQLILFLPPAGERRWTKPQGCRRRIVHHSQSSEESASNVGRTKRLLTLMEKRRGLLHGCHAIRIKCAAPAVLCIEEAQLARRQRTKPDQMMAVSARNGTLPSWLLVALILLFACEVQATARLASFFPRYFPDRNTDNGCKDHVKELTDSYEEASTVGITYSSLLAEASDTTYS